MTGAYDVDKVIEQITALQLEVNNQLYPGIYATFVKGQLKGIIDCLEIVKSGVTQEIQRMTENEKNNYQKAQKWLESYDWDNDQEANDNLATICEALQEIQKYQAIGSVRDCHKAMEKQRAKALDIWGDGTDENGHIIYDMYNCPNCGKSYEIDYDDYKYCPNCGQKMERTNLE